MFRLLAYLLVCTLFCSCVWNDTESNPEYLPLDDSEYPYADLPRLVIETENFREIRDTDTDIPAKMQVYGKDSPESEIADITVKGHGNSSFKAMSKYSFKIELQDKEKFLGMPKENEWILISNFADKTLLKNYTVFKLAQKLRASFTPRSLFCEVFLNRQYMGIYQLTESIKVSKKRVNISEDNSYLFEKTSSYHLNGQIVQTKRGTLFRVRYPKNAGTDKLTKLQVFLDSLEGNLFSKTFNSQQSELPLDIHDFIRYYWLLEFSKNHDGRFNRSIFFTWEVGDILKMGPVWDFDETFGCTKDNMPKEQPEGWYVKKYGWNEPLFNDLLIWQEAVQYWKDNRSSFLATVDSIDSYAEIIRKATANEFRRWNVLENTEFWAYKDSYETYDEALDSLKSWIRNRITWIDDNI